LYLLATLHRAHANSSALLASHTPWQAGATFFIYLAWFPAVTANKQKHLWPSTTAHRSTGAPPEKGLPLRSYSRQQADAIAYTLAKVMINLLRVRPQDSNEIAENWRTGGGEQQHIMPAGIDVAMVSIMASAKATCAAVHPSQPSPALSDDARLRVVEHRSGHDDR
jgi:hypothetical protein